MSNRKGSSKVFVKYADYSLIPESLGLLRRKYEELERQIMESGTGTKEEFAIAEKAEYRDLLLAHDKFYIDEFMNVKLTPRIIFSGLPFSATIRDLFLMNMGATILTLELAIENGVAMCIGGGAIHAHMSQGAAFCLINDVAVALLRAKVLNKIKPDALIYLAGAASIKGDSTSTMNLSVEGLVERDELIIGGASELGIPVAVLTSASFDPEDRHSVEIHLNTAKVVKKVILQGRT